MSHWWCVDFNRDVSDSKPFDLSHCYWEIIKMNCSRHVSHAVRNLSYIFLHYVCHKCCFGISSFIEKIFSLSQSIIFLLFLCSDHWGRTSYLSLLLFGTLHSNGYVLPFLLCLLLIFFSQLFVRPHQRTILHFCISFSLGWSWSLPPVQRQEPPSIVLAMLSLLYLHIHFRIILNTQTHTHTQTKPAEILIEIALNL